MDGHWGLFTLRGEFAGAYGGSEEFSRRRVDDGAGLTLKMLELR